MTLDESITEKKKNTLIFFFFILFFIEPNSLRQMTEMATMSMLYRTGTVLSFTCIFVYYFIFKRRLSYIILLIIVFQFSFFIQTITNSGNIGHFVNNLIFIVGFCMLTEIMLAKNPVVYFKYVFFVLFILAMINFVTVLFLDYLYVIVNRYGWTAPGWFLGHRNQHVYFLLPLVIISFILKELHYHKTYFWIAFSLFISLITVVTTWSATSIVTLSLMAIYFVFIYNKKSRKIFNIKTYMFVFLMFTIILLLQFQEYFAFIIEDLLDRNLTFTMRTTIWNEAVDLIQKKPWFGHGYGEIVFRNNLESTHNAFFQILFNGGIISLILCTIILLVVVNRLKENKYNKISDILQFAIFLYLIQMLFESRLSTIFFALLVVGFHIEKLVVTTSNLNGTTPIKLSFTNMGDENIV